MRPDVAAISAREGAEVVLVSRATIDKMDATKHEVEHALAGRHRRSSAA